MNIKNLLIINKKVMMVITFKIITVKINKFIMHAICY